MQRISPESPLLAHTAVALALMVAASSFVVSFTGLIAAAGWAGIPPLLRPALPIVVDSSILVFTVAAVVARGRGESTRLAWGSVGAFTAVSVITNAAHAIGDDISTATSTGTYALGALLAGIMPLACLVATHTVVSLVVAPPEGTTAQRRKAERARNRAPKTQPQEGGSKQAPTPAGSSRPATAPSGIDYQRVRALAAEGLSQRAIAEEIGTSKSTVARALKEPPRPVAVA